MASGSGAEREFAAVSGSPLVTVHQTARELQQAEPALWLRTGKGRREANVELDHLVNLTLGVALGPPSKAVENVLKFRSLTSEKSAQAGTLGKLENNRWFPGNVSWSLAQTDLANDLAELIHFVAFPDDFEKLRSLENDDLNIRLETIDDPEVEIYLFHEHEQGTGDCLKYAEPGINYDENQKNSGRILRTSTITYPLVKCLSSLWRHSVERFKLTPNTSGSGSSLPGDASRNENAALPGAAPRRPRTQNAADGFPNRRHPIPEGLGRQDFCVRSGPSHVAAKVRSHDPSSVAVP